jgi:hypothetical protein
MLDTGASSHFTPCLSDMKEVEEGLDLGVKVADGHIVQCTTGGIVEFDMINDDGLPLKSFFTWRYLCSWSEEMIVFFNYFGQQRSLCYCEEE